MKRNKAYKGKEKIKDRKEIAVRPKKELYDKVVALAKKHDISITMLINGIVKKQIKKEIKREKKEVNENKYRKAVRSGYAKSFEVFINEKN